MAVEMPAPSDLDRAILLDVYDVLRVAQVHSLQAKLWQAHAKGGSLFSGVNFGRELSDRDRTRLAEVIEADFNLGRPTAVIALAKQICDTVSPFQTRQHSRYYHRFYRNLLLAVEGKSFTDRANDVGLSMDFFRTGDIKTLNALWNGFWLLDAPTYLCLKITLVMEMIYDTRLIPWYPHEGVLEAIYHGLPGTPLRAWCESFAGALLDSMDSARHGSSTLTEWFRAASGLWIDFELLIKLHQILAIISPADAQEEDWLKRIRRIEEIRADLVAVSIGGDAQIQELAAQLDESRKSSTHNALLTLQILGLGRSLIPYAVAECLGALITDRGSIESDPLRLRISKLMEFKCSQELSYGFAGAFDAIRQHATPSLKSVVERHLAEQIMDQWNREIEKVPDGLTGHLGRAQVLYWQGNLAECVEALDTIDGGTLNTEGIELRSRARRLLSLVVPGGACSEQWAFKLINDGLACSSAEQLQVWFERAIACPECVFFKALYKGIESAKKQGLEDLVERLCSLFSLRMNPMGKRNDTATRRTSTSI